MNGSSRLTQSHEDGRAIDVSINVVLSTPSIGNRGISRDRCSARRSERPHSSSRRFKATIRKRLIDDFDAMLCSVFATRGRLARSRCPQVRPVSTGKRQLPRWLNTTVDVIDECCSFRLATCIEISPRLSPIRASSRTVGTILPVQLHTQS